MTTLSSSALTTVDNARLWLRRNNVVSVDDTDVLTLTINGVSDAIHRYCGREFTDLGTQTRTFKYDGDGFVNLYPYDLRSITTVTLGATVLTASTGIGDGDYFGEPRNKTREGTYLFLTMKAYYKAYPKNSLHAVTLNERDVVIVGSWGMSSVPAAVEMACLEAVADTYRNPEQEASRGSGEFQITEAPSLPGEVFSDRILGLIDPFVRPVSG